MKGRGFSRAVAASSSEVAGFSPEPGLKPAYDKNDALNGTPEGVPFQSPSPADATLTRTGSAMGTAGYMSPEQVRGEKLDARTDIFSFGLVLYEMATGQRAFSGETAAVVHEAIVNDTPVPVRELNSTLPAKLLSIIDKALEKDRDDAISAPRKCGPIWKRFRIHQGKCGMRFLRVGRWAWPVAAALALTLTAAAGWWWSWALAP